MKCLLKYQWVKLPRNQLPPGKGIMGAWARLASRAAFRSGQAHYCRYINKINAGGWAGGIVGLKSILAVKRRQQALKLMNDLKAYYSLDHDNGIENTVINRPLTPEEILEDKQRREQLYAAVMALPDKQAKRIYARFYLGMTPTEIAEAEGVDVSRVRDSIRRGLKHLAKLF